MVTVFIGGVTLGTMSFHCNFLLSFEIHKSSQSETQSPIPIL
ncbi:hypothetical protein F383_08264 [Gossypium arboreum]|uniref:Uncharacterized protein n=1 Tax=Gossypium arboreum TaxID=29729 RepID=A0A0B0PSQ9_GOSAR|nr:hypothetical protein F383_08264 [Gossypium arboreum]